MSTATLPQIQAIPLDQIVPSPYQTRKDFDEEKLKELAQTMKDRLIHPVVVRKVGGTYELIAGERRTRAARLLGWKTIEAKIEDVDDKEAARLVVVENLQRDDLNPIEQAEGYKRLQDLDLSLEVIANKVGVADKSTISRYLALLEMPKEIQEMLPRGNISERHARAIRLIKDEGDQIKFARRVEREAWSVMETERRVQKLLEPSAKDTRAQAPVPEADPLADVWGLLKVKSAGAGQLWGVDYRTDEKIPGVGVAMPAWHFWIANQGVDPREDLKRWAAGLLGELGGKPDAVEARSEEVDVDLKAATPVEVRPDESKVDPALLKEAIQKMKSKGPSEPRLPANKQEQAEVEALAAKGPQAVYAWIYGKDHVLTVSMAGTSWKQMGYLDPVDGARELLQRIDNPRKKGLWGMFS